MVYFYKHRGVLLRQYRIILSADTASEVPQPPKHVLKPLDENRAVLP